MKYLKQCVRSAVIDGLRTKQGHAREDSLESAAVDIVDEDFSLESENTVVAQLLWQTVLSQLHSEQERLLLMLTYYYGLKPSEVQQHSPHLFSSVESVYNTKRNLIDRLRRNYTLHARCLRIFQGDEPDEY